MVFLLCVVGFLFTFTDKQVALGAILNGPSDTVALRGTNVMLTCTPDSTSAQNFEWVVFISNQQGSRIYSTSPGSAPISNPSKYQVNGTNLVIMNVDFSDGGSYDCRAFSDGANHVAQLVVVDQPIVTANQMQGMQSGGALSVQCSALYAFLSDDVLSSANTPTLAFYIGNSVVSGASLNISAPRPTPNSPQPMTINATYAYNPNQWSGGQQGGMNSNNISCMVSTQTSGFSSTGFYALPASPYGIQFNPPYNQNTNLAVGSNVTCMAYGNPSPNYTWTSGTGGPINTQTLFISGSMMKQNNIWNCTATNMVNGNKTSASLTYGPFNVAGGISEASSPQFSLHLILAFASTSVVFQLILSKTKWNV